MNLHFKIELLLLSISLSEVCDSARILGIFPVPSISHQVVYRQVMLALSAKGHDIVIVTTDPIPNPPKNYKQIDIGALSYHKFQEEFNIGQFVQTRQHAVPLFNSMLNFFTNLTALQFETPQVQNLAASDEKFDLLFLEWLIFPSYLGFAHKFKVPVIGISSLSLLLTGFDSVGSPSHPAYLPDLFTGSFQQLSFWERLDSTYFALFLRFKYYYDILPKHDAISKRTFGEETPYVGDMEKNVSLIFTNTHHTTSIPRPLVPAIIEIGGPPVHMAKQKPLPEHLQVFLDSAEHGVIYFSLGSNVKSAALPEAKRQLFLNVFRMIKQKVLWKWETDDLPGRPDNVKIQKWLPQTDVLAHDNVKLFITQGGLQSTGEATHFGKPMVVIPFFADQELNAKKINSIGGAEILKIETLTENDLLNAINKIIADGRYKRNIEKHSELTRDQPQPPIERAVWWTEYVIRHKGARHLRCPAVDLPWYQFFMLDIAGFAMAVVLAFYLAVKLIIRQVLQIFRKTPKIKTK